MKGLGLNWLLLLGSGIAMSTAAAPLNWWPLAWVTLIPLWMLARTNQGPGRSRRSLLYALAWGVGYHGLTLSWILGLHPLTWMGVPWLASIAIAVFCWLFVTLWGTAVNVVWIWLMGRVGAGHRGTAILVGTALWCGLEFGLNLTPLSWTSLSFTQSPGNLVILHLGRISGPFLVTAVIVAFNGLLAEALLLSQQQRHSRQEGVIWAAIAVGLLIMSHAIGWQLYTQPLADTPDQRLMVGMVQGNIPTREKLSATGIQRSIRAYVGGYEALASQGIDAVLTPEGALPLLWEPTRNPFHQAVLAQRVPAWLGSFVAENGNITQSLLALAGNGDVVGRYNKVKLVPLGEYIPFQETIGGLIGRLSPIKSSMVPGQADQRFDTPLGRAIASICYESVFPELFRVQAAAGGQFILTASNLDPYSEVLMAQHQAHDLMRAIETDRWAARATNTGYSGVIDPHGQIRWRSQPQQYQFHAEPIFRRQTQTLYVTWGDWVTPLLLGWAALVIMIRQLKPASN
jgi:apolipoprotein N-acyltransferase